MFIPKISIKNLLKIKAFVFFVFIFFSIALLAVYGVIFLPLIIAIGWLSLAFDLSLLDLEISIARLLLRFHKKTGFYGLVASKALVVLQGNESFRNNLEGIRIFPEISRSSNRRLGPKQKKVLERYELDFIGFCELKRKKASDFLSGAFSSGGIAALSLLALLYFFNPFSGNASTFGYVQTDWAGGASTTAYATHSSNRSGWNYFYSKDSGIEASSSIALMPEAVQESRPASSYFLQGTSSNLFLSGAGDWSYLSLSGSRYFENWGDRLEGSFSGAAIQTIVVGDYAYMVSYGSRELYILDVANKSNPVQVGYYTTTTPSSFYSVAVSGDYAYIATNNSMIIVDVSNKANPVGISRIVSIGDLRDISVSGDYAYLAANSYGLRVVNISNKSAPTLAGSLALSGITGVDSSGDGYVYATYSASGYLGVVDVSNPASPSLLGYGTGCTGCNDVIVSGSYAYAAGTGISIFDISNKSAPARVGYTLNYAYYYGMDIALSGNRAFIASSAAGISMVDVSNPANPVVIGNYNDGDLVDSQDARGVFVSGNYAYLSDAEDGLKIFDISGSFSNPTVLSSYASSTWSSSDMLSVNGNYAYLGDSRYVSIIDISDESNPVFIKKFDAGTGNQYILAEGNYLYVAKSTGLRIIDVSNKLSPSIVGNLSTYNGRSIKISGNYLYLADYSAGMKIIDISDKANPAIAGSLDLGGSLVSDLAVSGDYAYLSISETVGGLQVVDISNKSAPALVGGRFNSGPRNKISLDGNYVYLYGTESSKGGVFDVYDISNQQIPVFKKSFRNIIGGSDITAYQDYLIVSSQDNLGGGIMIFDVSDPVNLYKSNDIRPASTTKSKAHVVAGNFIYYINESGNLNIASIKSNNSPAFFISGAIDSGSKIGFGTSSWSIYSSSSVHGSTVKIRSASNSNMSDADDWSGCGSVSSGSSINSSNCVSDADRYFQYRFDLTTSNSSYSPKIYNINFNYSKYPSSQSLVSSPFNSENSSNLVADISWTESLPAGTDAKFQIRTAPDSGGQPGSWTDWLGPAGTSTFYSAAGGRNSINPAHRDGSNDQWVQYKVVLESDGGSTPIVDNIQLTYVSNVPPEFASAITASQRVSDGKVEIAYRAKDTNTNDSEAGCRGCVVPSFEYSIDGGSSWNAITSGLDIEDVSTTSIESDYSATTTVVWNAKAQLDGVYSADFKVRVILDDREGTNNLGYSESASFGADFKNPELSGYGITVIATSSPAKLLLAASDDSADLQMCITLNNTESNCLPYNATSSIALATNPDVVYVKFIDKYRNSVSASAATPETPTNIMIRDNSDLVNAVYQEFLAWKAVGLPFAKYQVWYSTDNLNFSLAGEIDDRSTNYYFHQGLSLGQNYYYKVTVEDDRGNVSYYSSAVSDQVDGSGGTDTIPPVISNVEVISTTTQSAVIEWDTNQFSNSQIHLSTIPGDFSETVGSVTMADSPNGLGRHHVVLNNLSASTTYYFSVESVNTLGISATDNNGGDGYSFTTKSGPVISGVTASQITNNGATIIWNTDIAGDSYVVYSSSSNFSVYQEVGSGDNATFHSVSLSGLSKGTVYYYYVRSGVASNDNGGAYFNFTTAVDDVAPVISGVATAVATDNKALISWSTNELADSKVEYGLSSGIYSQEVADGNFSTNHNVLLSGLSSSTTYYYRVVSTDNSGNISSSTEVSFTTLERLSTESEVLLREGLAFNSGYASSTANATSTSSTTCPVCPTCSSGGGSSYVDRTAPQISDIKILESGDDKVKIYWATNESSNSFVEYGKSSSYGFWQGSQEATTTHYLVISDLDPGTSYYYRINSTDGYGNIGLSENQTFETSVGGVLADSSQEIQSENGDSLAETEAKPKDAALSSTVDKAMEIISGLANQVSVSALESALSSQYNLIRQLSQMIPAPILGGEPRVTVTADTATVTWSTDKESNSLVAIAPADKYNAAKGDDGYLQVIGNPDELVKNHIVKISNLSPEVIYNYQVRSMSSIGSLSKSSNFVFKTGNRELEISNYTTERVSDQEAVFRWLTSAETDSSVKYTPYRDGELAIGEAKTEKVKTMSTIHEVAVDDFESGVAYEIELSGKNSQGEVISKKIAAFSTGDDNFPPTIYQVQTESAIFPGKDSNIQTIISWLTNEPATGQVFYRKGVSETSGDNWEKMPLENSYAKKHIAVITKFEPGSIYQFRLQSSDSAGNLTVSKVYTVLAPKQKDSVFQVIIKNFEDIFGWTKQLGF